MSKLVEQYSDFYKMRQYIEGYRKYPEKDDPEIEALMKLGLESFSKDEW